MSTKLCGAVLLNQLLGGLAINEGVFGAPFEKPPEISAGGTTVRVTLTFDEYLYKGPQITQKTRVYNGAIAGPTIRAKPGDTIELELINNLPTPDLNTTIFHNICRDPDKTNMHPHGLHVSSQSPGDNVLIVVNPGSTYTYKYEIPSDHMGGTFWYHAHHHGSTNLQAGGAGGGMIIIEDAPGVLPPSIAGIEDIPMTLANLDMPTMYRWSQKCIQQCVDELGASYDGECRNVYKVFAEGPERGSSNTYSGKLGGGRQFSDPAQGTAVYCGGNNVPGTPQQPVKCSTLNTILVNGMSQPIITMVANRWYRWRMIFAAVQNVITPKLQGCEMGLLAKDGVYLPMVPRTISAGFMAPGNRADWVVRCPAGSHAFVSNGGLEGGFNGINTNPGLNKNMAIVIATVVAVDQGEQSCDLGSFSVPRPCYLADLTGTVGGTAVVVPTATTNVSFPGLGISPALNGCKNREGGEKSKPWCEFNMSNPLDTWTVGTVNHYRVAGAWAHPFHQHVNHFQINSDLEDYPTGYFKKGDWHDTILIPGTDANIQSTNAANDGLQLLTPTDRFTGNQIVHCHFLEHEDQGMMSNVVMTGTEGTRSTQGKQVMANGAMCYEGAYVRDSPAPTTHRASSCAASPLPPSPPSPDKGGKQWDDPAIVITVLAGVAVLLLLIVLIMLIACKSGGNKDIQFTSATPAA